MCAVVPSALAIAFSSPNLISAIPLRRAHTLTHTLLLSSPSHFGAWIQIIKQDAKLISIWVDDMSAQTLGLYWFFLLLFMIRRCKVYVLTAPSHHTDVSILYPKFNTIKTIYILMNTIPFVFRQLRSVFRLKNQKWPRPKWWLLLNLQIMCKFFW